MIVFPVTVRQSPCISPLLISTFINGATPPILTSSAIEYFPLGFKSARTGVFFPILSKSFNDSFNFASLAIANKCKTALVDPPSAMTTVIAFSRDFFVTISLGLRSFLTHFIRALLASFVSSSFDFEIAV